MHITYNVFTNGCMSIDIYSLLSAFALTMYYPSKQGRNSHTGVEKVTSASTIEISLRKTQLFCQKRLNVRIGFKI